MAFFSCCLLVFLLGCPFSLKLSDNLFLLLWLFSLFYAFFFLNCCPFYYGFLLSGRSLHCSYLSVALCFCFSFLLSANDNQHTDGKPVLDCLSFHVGHSFLFSVITHPDVKSSSIHHWCPVFNVCVVIFIIMCVCVWGGHGWAGLHNFKDLFEG